MIGRDKIGSQGEEGFWTRQLDFFFIRAPDSWVSGSTDNLQLPGRGSDPDVGISGITSDPMLLSDHCPIVGIWSLTP